MVILLIICAKLIIINQLRHFPPMMQLGWLSQMRQLQSLEFGYNIVIDKGKKIKKKETIMYH